MNDHDQLRRDPLLATLAGKFSARRKGCDPLADKSTLNRLEHTSVTKCNARNHKIAHDPAAFESLLVDCFIEAPAQAPVGIILDLDATDDPLHGQQEGRFFHGYYGSYCYLPLYIFCGRHLIVAKPPGHPDVRAIDPVIGLSVSRLLPLGHMLPSIPPRNLRLISRFSTSGIGLPCILSGPACASSFSGPARRSLTLWPVWSPSPQRTLYTEGSNRLVTYTIIPVAAGRSDSCRVGFAPTGKQRSIAAHETAH